MEQPPGIPLNINDDQMKIIRLIREKDYEQLESLLQDGLDPNITYGGGGHDNITCMLTFVIDTGDFQMVQLFLNHGANPNIETIMDSPIHRAIRESSENIIKLLIDRGANINIMPEILGATALRLLATRDVSDELIKLIISHSDNIDKPTRSNLTALHCAAMYNNLRLAKHLIEAGADMTLVAYDNKTALDLARDEGFDDMVKLIESFDIPDNKGAHE